MAVSGCQTSGRKSQRSNCAKSIRSALSLAVGISIVYGGFVLASAGSQAVVPAFDHAKYDAIGESDRMTLRFGKPG